MPQITVYNKDTNAKRTRINGEYFFRYTGSDQIGDEGDGLERVVPGQFSKFAVRANRILTEGEVDQLIGIVSFYWKTVTRAIDPIKVDSIGLNSGDFTAVVFQNALYENGVSRSYSSDPEYRFAEFVIGLNAMLATGTKVRADGTQRVSRFATPVTVGVYLNEIEESVEVADAAPAPEFKVEIPWEDNSTDYFATKNADDLTFSDVRLLLATLRAEQKKNKDLKVKVSDLEGKLATIQAVFN